MNQLIEAILTSMTITAAVSASQLPGAPGATRQGRRCAGLSRVAGSSDESRWDDLKTKLSDMIVTFVLTREAAGWKASEIQAHNVDQMNLSYSNPGQKH